MVVRLLSIVLVVAALTPSALATRDSARSFLANAFALTAADLTRLDGGEVISRTLDVTNNREVATLGIVRISTPAATYVERLSDIVTFKRADGVLQIGKFSHEPQLEDTDALTIDDGDVKRLRSCRMDDCKLRLSADGILRAHREIDWQAPDASRQASRLIRQLITEYAGRYVEQGASTMEYAGRVPTLNVGREFAVMLDSDRITAQYAAGLRRHLLDYPAPSADGATDFLYWSKELVRGRPVVSITHVATVAANDDSPVAYAIGSKQIYAMHYFDASLGLTLLVPDRTTTMARTYVVYLNRSRIDLFGGLFGGTARRIVAGRARSLVADQLQRLQAILGGQTGQAAIQKPN